MDLKKETRKESKEKSRLPEQARSSTYRTVQQRVSKLAIPTITYKVNEGLPTAFLPGRSLVETDVYLSCHMTCIRGDEMSSEPQDPRGSSLEEMALLRISLLVARLC